MTKKILIVGVGTQKSTLLKGLSEIPTKGLGEIVTDSLLSLKNELTLDSSVIITHPPKFNKSHTYKKRIKH